MGFLFLKLGGILVISSAIIHTDTLLNKYKDNDYNFNEFNKDFHIDLPRLKKAGVKLIVFAIYAAENYQANGDGLKKTIQMIDDFYDIIENCEELVLAKKHEDIIKINNEDKIAAILAVEGAQSIYSLSALRVFNRLGIKLITLTWNHRNQIGDGVGENTKCGLTNFGKEFVKEMHSLNMIVDVSHLNKKGFWDVIEVSEFPIIASHSNVKRICAHPRNLDDAQIKAIAKANGIIGINFCPLFLNSNEQADINDVFKHIDYIKNLVGVDFVGLGTDFDGISETPKGLEDVSKLEKLKNILFENSYSKQEVEKIFYKNVYRIFKNVLK